MGRLAGKAAIVTGAAQGIGLGVAKVFAREGAKVVLSDVKAEAGEAEVETIRRHGGEAWFIAADVSDPAAVEKLVADAVDTMGQLDIVVNNAGITVVKTCEESSVEEWDAVMNVNVRSIYLTTRFAVPHMRKRGGGSILNMASVSSFVGQQNTPAYVASKGAVLMLTKALAVDYGHDKITVNCVCPGITDTPLLRYHVRHEEDPDAHLRTRLARVPMGEMLYPKDMGEAAAFLCSDEARGITGASLLVDGGYLSCAEFFR